MPVFRITASKIIRLDVEAPNAEAVRKWFEEEWDGNSDDWDEEIELDDVRRVTGMTGRIVIGESED